MLVVNEKTATRKKGKKSAQKQENVAEASPLPTEPEKSAVTIVSPVESAKAAQTKGKKAKDTKALAVSSIG